MASPGRSSGRPGPNAWPGGASAPEDPGILAVGITIWTWLAASHPRKDPDPLGTATLSGAPHSPPGARVDANNSCLQAIGAHDSELQSTTASPSGRGRFLALAP
jgi:hypothetical protein